MSNESLIEFLKAANENESLARGLVEAVGGRQGLDASHAVANFAAVSGFEVSVEDAEALRESFTASEDELNDEQLNSVAGGAIGGLGMDTSLVIKQVCGGGTLSQTLGQMGQAVGGALDDAGKAVGGFFSSW